MLEMVATLPGIIVTTAADHLTDPPGWLFCDGRAISRETYAGLFAAIGTKFGVGDGSTTFNIPDLRGRGMIGSGTGVGMTERLLGASGGEESHVLSESEMPLHGHPYRVSTGASSGSEASGGIALDQASPATRPAFTGTPSNASTETIGGAGEGDPHNNMQPFAVINALIKT